MARTVSDADRLEVFKHVFFLCVCVSIMASFLEYNEGVFSTRVSDDPALIAIIFGFAFTALFNSLRMDGEINSKINVGEILVSVPILPVGLLLYGIRHEYALSIFMVLFAFILLALKIIQLSNFLTMARTTRAIKTLRRENGN